MNKDVKRLNEIMYRCLPDRDEVRSMEKAIKSLERNTPKKVSVIHVMGKHSSKRYACPNCRKHNERQYYCGNCGQKLGWEGIE